MKVFGLKMEPIASLPQSPDLSSCLISFFGKKLHRKEDLLTATDLVSELQKRCSDLDRSLIDLNQRLGTSIVAYASHSDRIGGIFCEIKVKLNDLQSSTRVSGSFIDGGEGEGLGRAEQILGEELPTLAKEVTRVETVRVYAESIKA